MSRLSTGRFFRGRSETAVKFLFAAVSDLPCFYSTSVLLHTCFYRSSVCHIFVFTYIFIFVFLLVCHIFVFTRKASFLPYICFYRTRVFPVPFFNFLGNGTISFQFFMIFV